MTTKVKALCFAGLALGALMVPPLAETDAVAAPASPARASEAEEGAPNMTRERGKDLGNGMRCTFSSDCASRNCTFKVCKAKGGGGNKQLSNGVACTFNSECASGSCTFKVCKAKGGGGGKQLGNGAKCTFNSDCLSKHCTFKVCKR